MRAIDIISFGVFFSIMGIFFMVIFAVAIYNENEQMKEEIENLQEIQDIQDFQNYEFPTNQLNNLELYYKISFCTVLFGIIISIYGIFSYIEENGEKSQPTDSKKQKNTVVTWGNKGLKYKKEKYYEVALECFNKGLEIDPTDVKTLYNKGNVLVKLERFKEAIECYNKVIKINPEHFDSWENRESAMKKLEKKDGSNDEEEVFELDEVYR